MTTEDYLASVKTFFSQKGWNLSVEKLTDELFVLTGSKTDSRMLTLVVSDPEATTSGKHIEYILEQSDNLDLDDIRITASGGVSAEIEEQARDNGISVIPVEKIDSTLNGAVASGKQNNSSHVTVRKIVSLREQYARLRSTFIDDLDRDISGTRSKFVLFSMILLMGSISLVFLFYIFPIGFNSLNIYLYIAIVVEFIILVYLVYRPIIGIYTCGFWLVLTIGYATVSSSILFVYSLITFNSISSIFSMIEEILIPTAVFFALPFVLAVVNWFDHRDGAGNSSHQSNRMNAESDDRDRDEPGVETPVEIRTDRQLWVVEASMLGLMKGSLLVFPVQQRFTVLTILWSVGIVVTVAWWWSRPNGYADHTDISKRLWNTTKSDSMSSNSSSGGDRGKEDQVTDSSSSSKAESVSEKDHGVTDNSNRIPESVPTVSDVSVEYEELTKKEPIGSGGNADVTKATLTKNDRSVTLAIKVPRMTGTLDTDTIEQLQAEAVTWDKLDNHDHIVGIVDYSTNPIPWIAMEHMDGGHLGEQISGMEFDQSLWTALAVTKAVRHAHRRGIAHLDLKPENVLFRTVEDAWAVPKVGDWGLSKRLLDHSESVEGFSPQYAAPEQFSEEYGHTDDITDIYQLGAVFYELFTGQPPFAGDTAEAVYQVLEKDPKPPSHVADLPEELDRILLKTLAKQKHSRYDDIVYLRDDLSDLFDTYSDRYP